MTHIAKSLVHFCTTKPKTIYWVLLLLTFGIGSQIPRIQIDTDPENMLSADHPSRVFHNQTKRNFNMYDSIVVGAVNTQSAKGVGVYNQQSLTAMHDLVVSILSIDGVVSADLMAVSTVDNISQEGEGTIRFEWMMKDAPTSEEEALAVQKKIERLPLLYNTLVSQNGKAAAIYVPIVDKNESYRIAEEIRGHIKELDSVDNWYITGLPVAEDQFGFEMFVQMGISAPLAGLTIFILLFLFFRNIPLITAPMIVAMATVIVTMGLLIGMGFTVHIMSSMIAIFLMPIAVVDSVHILSEFSDRYKPGENLRDVVEEVIGHLFTPMLYTSITSCIGFFSLMLTPIPPVQIFGAFVGFGILFAFLVTITFIPAYLSRMSDESLEKLQAALHDNEDGSRVAQFAKFLGRIANSHQGALLSVFAIIFGISVWGITQIQINDNPVRWFKADHEIRVADRVLNENFAGTYDAYLVISDNNNVKTGMGLLTSEQNMPSGLADWYTETEARLSALPEQEQLQQLIIAIDDQLFAADSDDQIAWLETLLKQAEQATNNSKTFQSPELLAYMSKLQDYLKDSGLVGKSNSLADVVKVVNRELRSGEDKDYQLPNSSNAVAQTLLQYQSSHRPNDLWHFVTPDYRSTLIWLQLTSGDNQDMTKVVSLVDEYVKANPLPQGLDVGWAGKAYLNVVWQENMVAGMLNSLLSAFVTVFIMMVFLFRSVVFGFLAMLPLTITIAFIYGLIGIVGKDYDMPIAVLSALTLGLSVDFAIHFLERTRSVFNQTGSIKETFTIMFDEPASAITRNALVIALGFTPLLFAPLVPYITVGFFLASIMAISALVTLLVLPSVMTKAKGLVFGVKSDS
ncbi:MMPL family transporter [Paraneptunicella aestuarii]|uniref:efflux RND transporter permease subunit n=1 Tax=Paraneptunicella aestuarii TaxID=2831148 RepID=UPI001E622318|nr:MMPL family transporter [Paraneptunicella aestuarii]UAA38639.1 MMPL family transporter [Paraneptunicella aestuarii]